MLMLMLISVGELFRRQPHPPPRLVSCARKHLGSVKYLASIRYFKFRVDDI